jgi:hypothetical protein
MLYTFGNQTGPIPLSQLDWNFAQIPNQSNVANTVLNNAQANITSVGQLTGLSVVGNVLVSGPISTGSSLTAAGNLGSSGSLTAMNMLIDNQGSSNAVVTGNLDVQGTLTFVGRTDISTGTLTITVGNTIADVNRSLLNGAGLVVGQTPTGNLVYSYLNNSFQSSLHFTPISNVAGLNLGNVNNYWNTLYASTALFAGNVLAENLSANTYTAANVYVSGEISAAGNVYINSSLSVTAGIAAGGTLTALNVQTTNLTVADTVNLANLIATGNIYAAGIVTGNITAANVATGNLLNTGLVTASSMSATGAITGDNFTALSTISAAGNITGVNLRTSGQVTAVGNVTGGNIRTAGSITATGNITGNNLTLGGNTNASGSISSAGNVTGANILTSGSITATGAATAASIAVSGTASAVGNVTGGNVRTAGNITATGNIAGNYFIGNGSQLTGISGNALAIVNVGGWSVIPSGTKLYFSYNGVNKGSLDSSGNFIVTGNVTAFGTP